MITVLRLRGTPWSVPTLTRLLVVESGVAAWLGICWVATSTTVEWSTQLIWVAGATGGLVVGGLAAAGWVLAGFRDVHNQQLRMCHAIAELEPELGSDMPAEVPADGLVSSYGMTRFHYSTCPLVVGKSVTEASQAQHVEAGRDACGVCRP